ncbi:MAG: DnaJ domain-containing protein [Clostridia bacterium]|nr:DnaJ domain-containing protein [Clostridia bacterium]
MNDPYEVLGVSRDASEEEINSAYRKMVKQYHPDKYVGNPLASLAAEKISEINEAYDAIQEERKNKTSSFDTSSDKSSEGSSSGSFDSNNVRRLIQFGRLAEAERILNEVSVRDAEWHFLMGAIMKRKGWYDMAYEHVSKACELDPSNIEYRKAKDNMDYSGTGYRNVGDAGGYTPCCDGCQTLICADCCCEMCGGNIIPCIGCR